MTVQDVPHGWGWVPLRDVTEDVPSVNPALHPDEEFGYVDIGSISNRSFTIVEPNRVLGRDAPSRARRPIREGDVLFSNVRTYLRNIAQVTSDVEATVASTGITVLRPNCHIYSRFLFHYVTSDAFINAVTPHQTGSNYPATSDRVVRSMKIPLPPLDEQRRIAAKLDDLLGRVAATRERLDRVPAILRRFRQSVLAAAVSGRLTEDWRIEHGAHVAPLAAQARTYADFPITYEPPPLPAEWRLTPIGELLDPLRKAAYGVLQPGDDCADGIPMVRVCDVMDLQILEDQLKRIEPGIAAQYRRTCLRGGEVLVTIVGTIGRVSVAPPSIAGANVARAIAVLPCSELVEPHFLMYALAEPATNWLLGELAREVARKTLNLGLLTAVPVPLPDIPEQQEIVRRVDALLSVASKIEQHRDGAADRVDRLSQSILARAFRGEL